MNRFKFTTIFSLLIIAFCLGPMSAMGEDPEGESLQALVDKANSQGLVQVIVGLNSGFAAKSDLSAAENEKNEMAAIASAQEDLLNRMSSFAVSNVKRFEYIPYIAMEVKAEGLSALMNDPFVTSIQEDGLRRPSLLQSVPRINGDDAYNMGYRGSNWAVAILDSGVRKTHQFLDGGKVVSEACYSQAYGYTADWIRWSACPGNITTSSTATGSGVNCLLSFDGCSHGTHVAGIAAGTGGISAAPRGVAPNAKVIAIQVFTLFRNRTTTANRACPGGVGDQCIGAYDSDIIRGLERVYALRGTYAIASVNLSLGGGRYYGYCDTNPVKSSIDKLRSVGIAAAIASGNDGWTNSVGSPGCISSAITVGATYDTTDAVTGYSNSATMVDMLAPGSYISSSTAYTTTSYGTWQGTSMATPHVAGAWAVMKSKNGALSVSSIESALESSGVTRWKGGIAKPRIDLRGALAKVGVGIKAGTNYDHVSAAYRYTGASQGVWAYMQSARTWLYSSDYRTGHLLIQAAASGNRLRYYVPWFNNTYPVVSYFYFYNYK